MPFLLIGIDLHKPEGVHAIKCEHLQTKGQPANESAQFSK